MRALPLDLPARHGEQQLTGVVCPDCAGVLHVQPLGRSNHLHFTCRIGHTYSVTELLSSKEVRVEERLWSAVVALEEMAALLGDMMASASVLGIEAWVPVLRDRRDNAQQQANELRSLIERERPVAIGPQEPSPEGDPRGRRPA